MNSSNNLTQTHINSRKSRSRSRSSSLVRSRSRTTPPSSPPPGGPSLLAKLTLPASTTTTTTTITTTTPAKLAPQQQQPIYYSITAEQLIQTLSTNQYTLILDIRTQSQFSQSHLRHSVNLNLPTTLLKRPLYGPDRIHSSLTTQDQRQRFEAYKSALPSSVAPQRLQLIIAIDQHAQLIGPTHPLTLLLNKFSPLGLSAQLVWLHGGYQALLERIAHSASQSLIITTTTTSCHEKASSQPARKHEPSIKNDQLRMSLSTIPLPSLAASLPTPPAHQTPSSHPGTATHPSAAPPSYSKTRRFHMSLSMLATPSAQSSPSRSSTVGSTSCYPLTTSSPSNMTPTTSHQQSSQPNPSSILNPFFDNIRQLNERLSLSSSLQNLSPIDLPHLTHPEHDLPRLPPFLRRLLQDSPLERARRLAHEFHDLEMAEQHRLEDVMRWESNRSLASPHSASHPSISASQQPSQSSLIGHQAQEGSLGANRLHHPFSISAGVELGYKNRYKNIWPYEHTRIRLRQGQGRRNDTDYMNASMINFRSDGAPAEMRSTKVGIRRYIATQGPLTSTFEDFWSVVGEEDVGMIIMITRRHEAGREKCADYLRNGQYGDLVVSVDHRNKRDGGPGGIESDGDEERDMASGFFGFPAVDGQESTEEKPKKVERHQGGVLRKMVQLSRTTRPDLPARKIAHIQYRGWPDFDVPPAAAEVLELIAESQRAADEIQLLNARAIEQYTRDTPGEDPSLIRQIVGSGAGPVIVHCSAGVGRTGSFILLDVMIEVLKAQYVTSTLHVSSSPPPPHPRTPQPDHKVSDKPIEATSANTPDSGSQQQQQDQLTAHTTPLPRFLDSQLCDCGTQIAPIWQTYPIMAVVNEMREQRMSMVANYRQYVFLHEVLLTFMLQELNISTTAPDTPKTTTTTTATATATAATETGPTTLQHVRAAIDGTPTDSFAAAGLPSGDGYSTPGLGGRASTPGHDRHPSCAPPDRSSGSPAEPITVAPSNNAFLFPPPPPPPPPPSAMDSFF